jgi:hypothetical protein
VGGGAGGREDGFGALDRRPESSVRAPLPPQAVENRRLAGLFGTSRAIQASATRIPRECKGRGRLGRLGSASRAVPRDVVRFKQYHEEGFADPFFCGQCGSGVYADGGQVYYVSAGVLQDLELLPAFNVQVANKAPWDEIGGNATQFPEYPSH